jgi:hypothetical protein
MATSNHILGESSATFVADLRARAQRAGGACVRRPTPSAWPRLHPVALLLLGVLAIADASAQGFPGKGGGGHRDGHRDSATAACAPGDAAGTADAFATFLGDMHVLRTELLIRDDQTTAWTAMRDALRSYVEQSAAPAVPADPLQRIETLADSAAARATALASLSATMAALNRVLDDGQRRTFAAKLQADFAAPAPAAR